MLAAEAPKITDWMQAWGSVVGLLLSGIAALATWLLFRHEIRVRRDERRDNEEAQARLVVGHIVDFGPAAYVDPESGLVGRIESIAWRVKNYSSAPIFNLGVWIHHSDFLMYWSSEETWDVVDDEIGTKAELYEPLDSRELGCFETKDFELSVAFTDANGRSWARVGQERPYRTTGDPLSRIPLTPLPWWPIRRLVARRERRRLAELEPPF
ncbi:hypothetical protein [Micromonospora sp. NBC_01796]|uniref:hypothetical protein n=1 Tax=Micromonospora sp. NBC_01796 TaxID=2975987 RepID=UPI002DDB96EE|nr:hypothetical protein [Micromonospora sp. NBC_01796]WSA88074.1 hypothetical protein OIE47_10945 [Micromonospora sp. NBC_01796]